MTAPNPKYQKRSYKILSDLFQDANNVFVIHYSCESFYDIQDGRSPRITSIAVRKLDTAQTHSFSIHQVAELENVEFAKITERYDDLEKKMLQTYFEFISGHKGMKFLHWNMRDINYGFAAIEHRFRVLGGDPYVVPDNVKFDLSRILVDIYGVAYINHPRLPSLLALNNITPKDFLAGSSEAEAFIEKNYVGLHQSTLRKVDVLANIASRALEKDLKTKTTWWEMHGGRLRTFIAYLAAHTYFTFGVAMIGIAGFLFTIFM